MGNVIFSTGKIHLKANQIACLEYNNVKLYGEVIQLIPHRQMCWFRPIYLIYSRLQNASLSNNFSETFTELSPKRQLADQEQTYSSEILTTWDESKLIVDLRAGSDLLWPEVLFRPALDTEVLDFLAQLKEINHTPDRRLSSQKYLNNFLHQVWQSHQDKF
ncbi:MAG: hypothetical protein AAF383_03655 [Cyanobacteria bacterium P01_A01_bin.83]